FIEHSVNTILRRAQLDVRLEGKSVLPMAGEYTSAVVTEGLNKFLRAYRPDLLKQGESRRLGDGDNADGNTANTMKLVAGNVRPRPPSFCTGCPERPIFTTMKLLERELGPRHVSCDIGCHLFSILPPFNIGNTTMGYGLGGAGASAFGAESKQRAIAVVGDGGFWHNGIASSVGNAAFNKNETVTIVVDNGYTAATGGQDVLSSSAASTARSTGNPIEKAARGV